MKLVRTAHFIGLMLVIMPWGVKAQFLIQTELRPKTESRDGFKSLLSNTQEPAFIISQRSRINLSYANEGVETYLSLQDVRVWGDEIYKTDNAVINVYQAYAAYHFNDNFSIKIGRQELVYDNKRLLGNRDWNNVGASHDIALLKFKKDGLTFDFAGGYNNEKEQIYANEYSLNYYKYLAFAWLNKTWENSLSFSVISIFDGYQDTNTSSQINTRGTSGFYTKWANSTKAFGQDAALYYQYGRSANNTLISAHYFSITQYYQPINSLWSCSSIYFRVVPQQ